MVDDGSTSGGLARAMLNRRQMLAGATGLAAGAALGATGVRGALARAAAQETATIGPAAERLLFSSFNVDQAPLEIQNDKMDLYIYGLKPSGADEVAKAEGVRAIQAPASTLSLILNPAPAREGELNPFAIREIRQAMQYLIDRDFIAGDIYGGRAVPMISHVSPLDYDELTVFETVRQAGIRYDPEYAVQLIGEQMQAAGAAQNGGFWTFDGKPVVIKIVVRVEDERRDVGDLIRAAMDKAGFQVQPIYQPFGPATLAVYASDPITFQWHAYTEGWGRSSPDRYDFGTINQMYAPWLGNMPGWLETGFWQYENEDLDAIGQRLYRGEFKSKDERDDIYRQMTAMGLDESVRLWIATALQTFPARNELENLTIDIVGGPKSALSLREASVDGSEEIRVGNLWIWTDRTTWNPVGGFGDVYSGDIYKNLVDAPIVNHPFSGLPIPFRASFETDTAGPDGTLAVPQDAVMWDAKGDVWTAVGEGVTAVSKVTYDYSKYFQAPFHHRAKISPADLIYSIAQSWELAYDENRIQIETALGVTLRPFLETFKGFRLLDDDRLETYVDFWHFEPAYIASYATVGGLATPWELLFAMDDIVFAQRRGAYSDTAAARFSVPWLSLVTETDARQVIRSLRRFAGDGTLPEAIFNLNGRKLVSADDAKARYQACLDWFEKTNLLVISNGPFFLSRYDPPAQFAQADAFRAEGYPFKPGDWNFGAPPALTLDVAPPAAAQPGDALSLSVAVSGPGSLAVRYALVDPAADPATSIVASGDATKSGEAFTIDIGGDVTGLLFPGVYQLYLLGSSDELARVTERMIEIPIGV
ncbi:MAG: ABC transporter substrate-binding protein [Thermomicrobiales bacterium]